MRLKNFFFIFAILILLVASLLYLTMKEKRPNIEDPTDFELALVPREDVTDLIIITRHRHGLYPLTFYIVEENATIELVRTTDLFGRNKVAIYSFSKRLQYDEVVFLATNDSVLYIPNSPKPWGPPIRIAGAAPLGSVQVGQVAKVYRESI